MSSPVLAITASRSGPTTSAMPLASLAPPVPPARTTTSTPSGVTRSLPQLLGKARQAYACVRLVAGIHRDEQRGHRLRDAGHLKAPAVDAAQALDLLDQRGRLLLVGRLIAADEHILLERVLEVAERCGAYRVKRRDHPDVLGHHLGSLLRGGPLPHAED